MDTIRNPMEIRHKRRSFADVDARVRLSLFGNMSAVASSPTEDPVFWKRLPEESLWCILNVVGLSERAKAATTTPLHMACMEAEANLGLVVFLVEFAGAEVEGKDNCGGTPLWKAFRKSRYATIKYLVQTAHADLYSPAEFGWTVLHLATFSHELSMLQFLVEQCDMAVDTINSYGSTALHIAAGPTGSRQYSKVEWLVTNGASVNVADKRGKTPLHRAAICSSVPAAKFLLENGALVEARDNLGHTALYAACKEGHADFCRFLVESPWNANIHAACPIKEGTLLHVSLSVPTYEYMSASACKLAKVKFLIEKGVNVHAVDEWNETALHVAVKKKMPLVVIQALVQAGGAQLVHAVGCKDKSTALHHAAKVRNLILVGWWQW
jgi:ankyrin repeat protein